MRREENREIKDSVNKLNGRIKQIGTKMRDREKKIKDRHE